MFRTIRRMLGLPADPAGAIADKPVSRAGIPAGLPAHSKKRTVSIPNLASGGTYEKDLSSPFWQAMAQMTKGAFVRYESKDRKWHVFTVIDPPAYARPGHHDLTIVVRRVSTGQEFTMPADLLAPCDASFKHRDGSRIQPGEGYR